MAVNGLNNGLFATLAWRGIERMAVNGFWERIERMAVNGLNNGLFATLAWRGIERIIKS